MEAGRKDQKKVSKAHPNERAAQATTALTRGTMSPDRRSDSRHHLPNPVRAPATTATKIATTIATVMRADALPNLSASLDMKRKGGIEL